MDFGIKGKVAIVTGTNRKGAMGASIATTLAEEGADIACVDIVMPGCEEVAKSIREMGRRAIAVKADQIGLRTGQGCGGPDQGRVGSS